MQPIDVDRPLDSSISICEPESQNLLTSAPISRLPAELLIFVFEDLIDTSEPQNIKFILPLSHVSQRWRDIALQTRSLWTTINLLHRGAENLIKRSASVPVHVHFVHESQRHIDEKDVTYFSWLAEHAHRVETLAVIARREVISSLSSVLGETAPRLLDLDISLLEASTDLDAGLDAGVFLTRAPALRRLELNSVSTNFGWYSNLVNLTVEGILSGDSHCPTGTQFIFLLQRCPGLQTMCLRHLLLDEIPDDFLAVATTPATLMHMQSLDLEMSLALTIFILRHIIIPLESPLLSPTGSDDPSSVGSFFILEVDMISGSVFFKGNSDGSTLWIAGDYISDSTIALIVAPPLDLSSTKSLSINGFEDGDPSYMPAPGAIWGLFFSRLPSALTIQLNGGWIWIMDILPSLFPPRGAEDKPPIALRCPHLQYLHLEFLDLPGAIKLGVIKICAGLLTDSYRHLHTLELGGVTNDPTVEADENTQRLARSVDLLVITVCKFDFDMFTRIYQQVVWLFSDHPLFPQASVWRKYLFLEHHPRCLAH